tara:strand:+ start:131 stop:472 length:342 start_codon:yes stop_codon:yes gene_type:complete
LPCALSYDGGTTVWTIAQKGDEWTEPYYYKCGCDGEWSDPPCENGLDESCDEFAVAYISSESNWRYGDFIKSGSTPVGVYENDDGDTLTFSAVNCDDIPDPCCHSGSPWSPPT